MGLSIRHLQHLSMGMMLQSLTLAVSALHLSPNPLVIDKKVMLHRPGHSTEAQRACGHRSCQGDRLGRDSCHWSWEQNL